MAAGLRITVGRVTMGRGLSPAMDNYVEIMREQMKVVVNNMKRAVAHIEGVTAESLRFGLQPIFDKSQQLVPVDTGDLRRSAFIEVRKRAGHAEAVIGYARYGHPNYAALVHERLDFAHQKGKQAKFLEAAVNQHLGDFERRVVLFIRKNTGISK